MAKNFTTYFKGNPSIYRITGSIALVFSVFLNLRAEAQDCTVNSGVPQTICPNSPLILTGVATGNLAATPDPQWTLVSGPGGIIDSPSALITGVTGFGSSPTSNTTIVYEFSATCLDGVRAHQTVTETILEQATAATVGPNDTVCSVGTYALAGDAPGTGASGTWSSYPSTGISFSNNASPTSNVTVTQPGIYTLTWTITKNGTTEGCTTFANMVLDEKGPAVISAGTNKTLSCAGSSTTLSASNPGLAPQVGYWTVVSGPNTPTFSNINSPTSTVSDLVPGVYVLQWNVSGPCGSGSAQVTITVSNINATQGVGSLSGSNSSYCAGAGVTEALLTGTIPIAGNTVSWVPAGSPATGTTIVSPNAANTVVTGLNGSVDGVYTYSFTITSPGGCTSTGTETIKFASPVAITPPADVNIVLPCGVTSTPFKITRTTPFTLTGSNITTNVTALSGGGNATLATSVGYVDSFNITGLTANTTNVLRFNYNSPCGNAYVDVTIQTSAGPTVVSNAGTDQILPCSLLTTNLAGNAVSAPNTGSWYQVSGPSTVTMANFHLYNTFVSGFVYGDYKFEWVITNGPSCAGYPDTVTIAVPTPLGSDNAGRDTTICYGTPYQMNSSGCLPGQSVSWSVIPSAGITFSPSNTVENPIINGTSPGTVYKFVKTISIPCGSITDTVLITTDSMTGPVPAIAGDDSCMSSTTTIPLYGNNPSPYTGAWSTIGTIPGTITSPSSDSTTVTGMPPGTYTFVWTINGGGCGVTQDTVVKTIAPAATTANAGPDQYLCNATSISLLANVPSVGIGAWTQSGGATGPTITSPASNATTVTGLLPGTYFFNWTISNGACASNASTVVVDISAPPTTTADAGPNQTICSTSTTLAANTPGTGQTGFWDIEAIPPGASSPTFSSVSNPTATISGLTTGTYVLKWSINSPGACPGTYSYDTINVLAAAAISSSVASAYCNVTSLTLVGTVNTNGTWTITSQPVSSPSVTITAVIPGYSYQSIITPLVNGVYGIRYDIAAGGSCAATFATKTVTINATPSVAVAGPGASVCVGTTSVTLAATAPAVGVGAWTTTSGPNTPTFGSASSATSTLSSLIPGVYVLKWTVSNGNCPTDTSDVQINVERPANAGANQSVCAASSVEVNGNLPVLGTGTWSYISGPAGSSITAPISPATDISGLTIGTYVFQWSTPMSGCPANTSNVTITNNPLPVVSAGSDATICLRTSTTLAATSGLTSYSWAPTTDLSCTTCASPTASPFVTTVYTVTGTNSNGCSNTATVTVNVNPLPTVSAGSDVSICTGNSTTLTATGGLTTYAWLPAAGLSCATCGSTSANPVTTTIYTVSATDANGCVNTDNVTVTVNPLPTISAGSPASVCIGNSTVLTATSGLTSYSWTPVTDLGCSTCLSTSASPATSTTYTVTGTNSNGCVNTASVAVTVNPLPTVSAGSPASICIGNSTTLDATSGLTSYSWSPSTGLDCRTCGSTSASPATNTVYTVTGTNSNGCANKSSVAITVNALPVISAGSPASVCIGNSTTLSATGGVSYLWSPSTDLLCTSCASTTATPVATSTYTVTGTNSNGCVNYATVVVTVNPLPTISAGSATQICAGSSASLNATSGLTAYSWAPSAGLSCSTCEGTSASPASSTEYTVTGTDHNGCVNNADVSVTVNSLPTISAGSPVAICNGSSTTLTATGGLTSYSWTPTTGLACNTCSSTLASPSATTTYEVSASDTHCSNTASVVVTVNPMPVVEQISGVSLVCIGTFMTLEDATPGGTWTAENGNATVSAGGAVSGITAGTDNIKYTVTVSGCTTTQSFPVQVNACNCCH